MMQRSILGSTIRQRSKDGFFSLTDLERIGNAYRLNNSLPMMRMSSYLNTQETKEFIAELQNRFGVVKIASRGRGAGTWGHPLLFIDMALTMHPMLKIEVYEWIKDELIKYRNDSGDSYKNMCGAIITRLGNKSNFRNYVKKVAIIIRIACGIKSWEAATEEQLKKRDRIQDVMTLYTKVLTNPNDCLRMAVIEVCGNVDYSCVLDTAKEEFNQTKK